MYLSIVSATIQTFILVLLLSKKDKQLGDFILAIWFGLISIHLLIFLQLDGIIPTLSFTFYFNEAIIFLHGPMLLFYTHSLLNPNHKFTFKRVVPHIIPALVVLAIQIGMNGLNERISIIFLVAKFISLTVYISYTYTVLRNFRDQLDSLVSNKEKINLSWLYFLLMGVFILMICSIVVLFFNLDQFLFNIEQGETGNILLCVFIIVFGYWGIRQTPILVGQSNKPIIPHSDQPIFPVLEEKPEKIESTSANQHEKLKFVYDKLLEYVSAHKPHLDPQLTLASLSDQLNIPSYQLSQAIKWGSQLRFFDFINNHRIKEFKEHIHANKHFERTILAIAFDCGFNSKAAFYRAFKKVEGKTPTEFIKSLQG